jgi:CHAD domain-containing protein
MRPAFARLEFPAALDTHARASWPLAATAQHVLLGHVRRLLTLRESAFDGDSDAIRRLRVAARRARTALADYASVWQADAVRQARRALGRLADRLGGARDLEVTLALAATAAAAQPESVALRAAITALEQRRTRARASTHDALRDFELAGWPARLVTFFASHPLDLWRYVDVPELLRDGEGTRDR